MLVLRRSMATLYVRRVGNSLHPDGADCAAVLSKLPFNRLLRVEIKQPRNVQFHRLYWALCARIGDAVGADSENISDLLKIETGHCTLIRSKKYGELRLPASIAFAAMDADGFRDFFDRCVVAIYEQWGISKPDILATIADLLDPPKSAA